MGYSSTVFLKYGTKKVSIRRLHGKMAAQALIGGQCFIRALDQDGSGDADFDDLSSAFIKQGYKRNNAMSLAAALLASSHEDEKDVGLTGTCLIFRELHLYFSGVLVHVVWCIAKPLCSALMFFYHPTPTISKLITIILILISHLKNIFQTAIESMISGISSGVSSLTETAVMKKARSIKEACEMTQVSAEEEDVYADVSGLCLED